MHLLFHLTYVGLALAASPLRLREDIKCEGKYANGQKYTEGDFVKRCDSSYDYAFMPTIACLTPSRQEIAVGETLEEFEIVYSCEKDGRWDAKLSTVRSPFPKILKCEGGYRNGQRFTEGKFVKRCYASNDYAMAHAEACLSPSGMEIAIGDKLVEGDIVFSCDGDGLGAKLSAVPFPSPSVDDNDNLKCADKYLSGERFKEKSFVKECSSTPYSWAIKIVGCLTHSGKEIALGGKTEEGKLIFSCMHTENGAKIDTDLIAKGCEDGKYKSGQTYLSSNKRFLLKCIDDYGSNDILACMTDAGKEVKVGEELADGVFKYRCIKESEGSVSYKKEPIGGSNALAQKGCGQYAVGEDIYSKDKKSKFTTFRFRCVAGGKIALMSCIINGREVQANAKVTMNMFSYE